jgi:hypothetical protein
MKLTIKEIIPVANHWNMYMNEDTQEEVCYPVCGLALVEDIGDEEFRTGETKWTYIDNIHIEAQTCPEAFESLSYLCTVYHEGHPDQPK